MSPLQSALILPDGGGGQLRPAFRVSDWSGTPQRGNPRVEYSGKRDPAAFEPGHAQKQAHREVMLIDEAHRTTGGDLGNFLMAGLPNASYLGFTGTPIDKTAYGRGTFKTFGGEDDKGYLHKSHRRQHR